MDGYRRGYPKLGKCCCAQMWKNPLFEKLPTQCHVPQSLESWAFLGNIEQVLSPSCTGWCGNTPALGFQCPTEKTFHYSGQPSDRNLLGVPVTWCFPFPCALGQTAKVSLNVSFLSPSFVFNLHVTVRNLFATVCTEATVQHQYRRSVHLGLQSPLHSGGSSMRRNGSDRPLARAPGCVSLRSNLLLLPDLPISYTGASSPLKSLSWQKGGWLWAPLLAANTTL